MSKFKKAFIIFVLAILIIPLSASAFWFWDKPAAKVDAITISSASNSNTELTDAQKSLADSKYKLWEASFEKKDVQSTITNQNNFWFNIAEINYLFNGENSKTKNPLLNNFKLIDNGGTLAVSANFKKIISGNFSFNVQITSLDKKLRLNISKLRFYGFPVPTSFISGSLNKSLDEYFSFLYNDTRFQGFNFSNDNGLLKLKPEFK